MHLVQIRPSQTLRVDGASSAVPAADPLLDRAARRVRYLRISLTDRCNYRCTYCMPDGTLAYGARSDVLSLEEVARLAAAFAEWGVRRVRLTGGEPTLRRGLVELVASLKRIRTDEGRPLEVVMTTNGERLVELAGPLHAAGLDALTVSVDSLDPERFARITRRGTLSRVTLGVEAARAAGFASIKINTVALSGFNDDELGSIARWAWSRDVVPRFIELMPMSGGELFAPGTLLPAAEVRARIGTDLGTVLVADDGAGVRGTGPATYWRVSGGPWAGRRIGTIAAMTENFCEGCNRLRISATGQLHSCLARDDTADLRAALRSGAPKRIREVVSAALGTKRDRHGFNMDGTGGPTKAMISIGG